MQWNLDCILQSYVPCNAQKLVYAITEFVVHSIETRKSERWRERRCQYDYDGRLNAPI